MQKKLIILSFAAVLVSACTKAPGVSEQDTSLSLAGKNDTQKKETSREPLKTEKDISTMQLSNEEIATMSAKVILKTSKGPITLKLYPEAAPETVKNFLSKGLSNYYNNLTFHRVEDWVIQGGDPDGNGTGGGKMPTELSNVPFKEGSLGVARGGDIRISNDSQFFICTKDCSWLTGQYTVFGEVTEGMDIAKSMEIGDKILELESVVDEDIK